MTTAQALSDFHQLVTRFIEYAQIVMNVPVSEKEKQNIKDKLNGYKERVENGEEFDKLMDDLLVLARSRP